VKLGEASSIEALVSQWRQDVTADLRNPKVLLPPSFESGAALRARIWDPVARLVDGADALFVVMDGSLALVPLAALPTKPGAYLVETAPPIHYLTAERDVAAMTPRTASASDGMLALGGPDFDDGPAAGPTSTLRGGTTCGNLQSIHFTPLDGTVKEVEEVAALWPAPLGRHQSLLGRDASEPAFKRDAHGYRVLHLATHGFFLDGSCLPASMPRQSRGVGGLSAADKVDNPLRLSGLALAGANRRSEARPEEDDGILTAEEVAALDLHGVEWAVLSACDTGVGEIKAGEGVFGLRRAFQVAGARTVIMSLWSVDDQATRAWMRALYEGRFQRQLSTADAVHQASLTVLRDRRARGQSTHPFFWAAFVAAGDWR
jgi:CHAT domain-containing protein